MKSLGSALITIRSQSPRKRQNVTHAKWTKNARKTYNIIRPALSFPSEVITTLNRTEKTWYTHRLNMKHLVTKSQNKNHTKTIALERSEANCVIVCLLILLARFVGHSTIIQIQEDTRNKLCNLYTKENIAKISKECHNQRSQPPLAAWGRID